MRYVCIHGHFYQPPRENPWTGQVPAQPSAAPFHDWNQRITAECYLPNAENYERISFNFGPTLLHWFEAEQPDLLRTVVEADRRARLRFGGHGREVLALSATAGLSYQDIGTVLGVGRDEARERLYVARQALRERLFGPGALRPGRIVGTSYARDANRA